MRAFCETFAILILLAVNALPVVSFPASSSAASSSRTFEPGASSDEIRAVVQGDPLSEVVAGYRPSVQGATVHPGHYVPERFRSFVEQGSPSQFWSPQVGAPVQFPPEVVPAETAHNHFAPNQGFQQPSRQEERAGPSTPVQPLAKNPFESKSHSPAQMNGFQQPQHQVSRAGRGAPGRPPARHPFVSTSHSPPPSQGFQQPQHEVAEHISWSPHGATEFEHAFLQSLHEVQAQQKGVADGLNPTTPPDRAHLEALAYAHMYEHRNDIQLTLAEREWLTHIARGSPHRGPAHQTDHMTAPSSSVPTQQSRPIRPIVLQAFQQQPVYQLSERPTADETHAEQAYKKSRGLVFADKNFVPPEKDEYTLLQHFISNYRLPSKSPFLRHYLDGTAKFYSVLGKSYGITRLAAESDLATKMSLVPLSNQKLVAQNGMWKNMGLRILFAQNDEVGFAMVDAQILKRAFPQMLEEDKEKLPDGTVAMIKIERWAKSYTCRLFSVLNLDLIKRLKL
ncbi:uncharacterized protein SPSC_00716 [Sporisorium scitamineum]|uniref:Uncharacterized protein n=1 Tax=Sporisorium scitamineum TaxID=49012 RepID=A0A0F7S109_9BASI|nr:uncharacterized protein SPSC_00716 [Sporisorium scitamineum]CDW96548.1 hypothetical protein [Sporisorium scitamineum]